MANTYLGVQSFKHVKIGAFFFDWVFNDETRRCEIVEGSVMLGELVERRLNMWRTSVLWNLLLGVPYWSMLRGDRQPVDEELMKLVIGQEAVRDTRVGPLLAPLTLEKDPLTRVFSTALWMGLPDGGSLSLNFDLPFEVPDNLFGVGVTTT